MEHSAVPLDELLVRMRSAVPAEREQAWAECYQHYRDLVWSRVFYVIRTISWLPEPREVAEDVTSEVFLGLPEAVKRYTQEGKAEQWLKQIAVRAAMRARERLTGQWRKGDTHSAGRRHESFDEEADRVSRTLDSVDRDEVLELEARVDALRRSSDLRERRWAEFIDLYHEGYGFAEIGARMGLTEGTARNWLVAIRKHLASATSAREDR